MIECLHISVNRQVLSVHSSQGVIRQYLVSTAKNGTGQESGSECTPVGKHRIRARIGDGARLNTVFTGRRQSGEIYSASLQQRYPDRDWILTRILWLCGCERGVNRLGTVDTMRRYIYIHGAPDSHIMGAPSSHGCIKMSNHDVVELFDQVAIGTPVFIHRE